MQLIRAAVLTAAASFAFATAAPAQTGDWPVRPLTIVVPYAAGGPVDVVARIIAGGLSEQLKQQVVVENSAGAGGMVGSARVAQAAPDGYQILYAGSAVLAQNQSIYKKPLVDGVKDFTPVAMFADQARLLVVRKDFPAKTLAEFNAYVKANPDNVTYGSAGAGSGSHVCPLVLDRINGTKLTHVPYRGSSQAMQDLIAGRIDFIAEQIATVGALVEAGQIRALAVLGRERVSLFPDLPSAAEAGLPEVDCASWQAFVLPRGAPDAVVRKLAQAVDATMETPAVKDRLTRLGVSITARERRTTEFLTSYTPAEVARWASIIKSAGVQLD